ncbi:MAG: acyltransferase domain-containing protein, partial [Desulfamplus sp.]|nr:acyltransferase domain-containing protein [Desulfamplus sp.]
MSSNLERKIAFVYAGIGTQWKTMGADLFQNQPIFRDTIEICDNSFSKFSNWSIIEEINRPASTSRIDNLLIAHPCNIAIQIGLSSLLKDWGIVPDCVVGHSSGELSAAYIAGIFNIQDAMHLTWRHCEMMSRVIGQGVLLHISLPEADVRQILERELNIWIAAINSPSSTVVTGAEEVINILAQKLEQDRIFCRILKINIPYHSPIVEPFINDFYNNIKDIHVNVARLPIYSTLRGGLPLSNDFGPDYWPEHISKPVQFAKTINQMVEDGYTTFIEISPHGVLSGAIEECCKNFFLSYDPIKSYDSTPKLYQDDKKEALSSSILAVPTLKRFTDANDCLTDSLAILAKSERIDPKILPQNIQDIVGKKISSISQSTNIRYQSLTITHQFNAD